MKYSDLLQFEPINEVVKFDRLDDSDYRKQLVKTFVFSKDYADNIIPFICDNLNFNNTSDTFGLQIVGNYGTGKSHLMSLFTLVAENADFLNLVSNDKAREALAPIAGKYKVLRFEMGNTQDLWDIVCYQLDKYLSANGVDYSIYNDKSEETYFVKLRNMMAAFEAVHGNKGLMVVIDEMLSYLKGRSDSVAKLNSDLAVLQALGQMSDHTRFRIVFGVQELIYDAPEFHIVSDMLNKVNDRFRQITITKQEVKFVTKQRLLKKTNDQKNKIRTHLAQFTSLFPEMHANLEEYVDLFPVHPAFFDNFQLVKIPNGQREILKTLSAKFDGMRDNAVPNDCPGLISFDSYWNDLTAPNMKANPDVKRINDIMDIIGQKISGNFTGAESSKRELATRIADACGVRILQGSLAHPLGITAEELADTLSWADKFTLEMGREFLIDTVASTAEKIITATVGQYFVRDEFNLEYHLRIEGGVNYEQKIKDYAQCMSDDVKDNFFYNFLVEYLPIETEQYRREFKIYRHRIEWKSHKTSIDGYIFMGNPDQRDTTHPRQHFYIYFMPIFNAAGRRHDNEPDSVYFHMENYGDEFRNLITLYGAADSLRAGADTSQKRFYDNYISQYKNQLKTIFATEFKNNTKVYYLGDVQNISPEMFSASSREAAVSNITSSLLEDYFCEERPNYPRFTMLRDSLTTNNQENIFKAARMRIANPNSPQASSNGDAILSGLGLLKDDRIDTSASIYALSIKNLLREKGEGQVLNQNEILECYYENRETSTYLWRSKDFHIEPELEFIVLSAMAALGEIEISVGNKVINAANISEIVNLQSSAMIAFGYIRRPKGIDIPAVRELMLGILKQDLTASLDDPATYSKLLAGAQQLAERAARATHNIAAGIKFDIVEVLSPSEGDTIRINLDRIKGIADAVRNYNTKAKLAHISERFSADALRAAFSHLADIDRVEKIRSLCHNLRERINYLNQARQYVTDPAFEAEIISTTSISGDVIGSLDDIRISEYRRNLDDLSNRYANWYISEYTRCHITQIQENERQRLLNDERLAVLRSAMQSNHISVAARLQPWLAEIEMLTPANTPSLQQVLSVPFHDRFDPRKFVGKQLPDLANLRQQLADIFDFANEEYHKLLKDPQIKDNVSELNKSEQRFFNEFENKTLTLSEFPMLCQVVDKLSQVIERKEITSSEVLEIFTRPMSPREIKREFDKLIDRIAPSGSDNIRIIIKQ
jgi:hypothetical protein